MSEAFLGRRIFSITQGLSWAVSALGRVCIVAYLLHWGAVRLCVCKKPWTNQADRSYA